MSIEGVYHIIITMAPSTPLDLTLWQKTYSSQNYSQKLFMEVTWAPGIINGGAPQLKSQKRHKTGCKNKPQKPKG